MAPPAAMPDRAWFRAHPETNLRLRDPLPGEVDELARKMLPAGVVWDGTFTIPAGYRAQVAAMKVSFRHVSRALAAAPCDKSGELSGPMPGFSLVLIALGARAAIG